MRRLTAAFFLFALTALVGTSFSMAAAPTRISLAGDEENPRPAGTLCDFNYTVRFHYTVEITVFGDGREQLHFALDGAHYNLDTGVFLTERTWYSTTFYSDHEKSAGIFWHLRDASGTPVVVYAGQLYLSDTTVKFTPNSGGSGLSEYAAVICPALGGNAVV
jgi:hypothetical protein